MSFNYLLYGDSYLTEYFRFDGICSLNTETRVGFSRQRELRDTVDFGGLREFLPREEYEITRVPSAVNDCGRW